jgi:hypothetical protein
LVDTFPDVCDKEQYMLLRKLAALMLSAALVLPLVGCGDAGAPAPVVDDTPAVPGDETEGTEATDTDVELDWDDDTTTGN